MSGNNGAGATGDAEFDAFASTGDVEGSFDGVAGAEEEKPAEKPEAKRRGPPREAKIETTGTAAASEDDADQDGDGEDDEDGEDEDVAKPKKSAQEHQIERLKREKRDLMRQLREGGNALLERRLEGIEKRLQGGNEGDTPNTGKAAPDPSDTDKYPLGHLDDRYIEDKLEWLAEQKAAEQANSVLQRQQESEQERIAREAQTALLEKVDTIAAKGSELFEDFQEVVVEAGMRGDWDLSQTTFEAVADLESGNGPQILYELSQDPKEATRIKNLPPIQQLKFVMERDAAIGAGKKGRTKPQAGEPPKNPARGANSKVKISGSTDNLDDFEKAWKQDEKS